MPSWVVDLEASNLVPVIGATYCVLCLRALAGTQVSIH
jgi:hypothetical protein